MAENRRPDRLAEAIREEVASFLTDRAKEQSERRSRENPQKFLSNALRFPYDDAHSLV